MFCEATSFSWNLIPFSLPFLLRKPNSFLLSLFIPSSSFLLFLLQKKLTQKGNETFPVNSFSSSFFLILFTALYANNTSMVCGRSIQIGSSFLLFFSPSFSLHFHTHFSIFAITMERFLRLNELSFHGGLRGKLAASTDESEIHHTHNL